MIKSKSKFKYDVFFNTLNQYLTYLVKEHKTYAHQMKEKRKYINSILSDIENNPNNCDKYKEKIEYELDELSYLENTMIKYYDETSKLRDLTITFPNIKPTEENIDTLNNVNNFFIENEQYENCIIIKEVIDYIN